MLAAEVDPDTLHTRFAVAWDGETTTGVVPSPGIHMAHNAVGTMSVGVALGLPLQGMVERVGTYAPVGMRLRMEPGPLGTQIINDAYNANPMSVAANLRTLAGIPRAPGRRRIALLGDMLELGPTEIAQHRDTIALAQSLDLDLLGLVGPRFEAAAMTTPCGPPMPSDSEKPCAPTCSPATSSSSRAAAASRWSVF